MPNSQNCLTTKELIDSGATIIKNDNGTLSVFTPTANGFLPKYLNKTCCEYLNTGSTKEYFYDIENQECMWVDNTSSCDLLNEFKIVLNPNDNGGVLFTNNDTNTCVLDIDFQYIVKFDSRELVTILTDTSKKMIDVLESINLDLFIDIVNPITNRLETVYSKPLFNVGSGKLYNHLISNINSGFLINEGDDFKPIILGEEIITNDGKIVSKNLISDLSKEGVFAENNYLKFLPKNSFNSSWLSFNDEINKDTTYNGKSVLSEITNKNIKISVKFNSVYVNSCILIDKIGLNRNCKITTNVSKLINKSPGFKLNRVIDNKKSWVSNPDKEERIFDLSLRETDYLVNSNKLVINTKEIDLDISNSAAIERDTWKFLTNYETILSGVCYSKYYVIPDYVDDFYVIINSGGTYSCGDNCINLNELITTPLSALTTDLDFINLMISELIDVKSRKTISSYPTIRLLYERYLNSIDYTDSKSQAFDYEKVDKFSDLIGDYWVDLIEQVIPSTTIWGSTKVYKNTVFDIQKYKYRTHTLITKDDGEVLPFNVIGSKSNVEVLKTTIQSGESNSTIEKSEGVYVIQRNFGSEFLGTITIT